MCGVSRRSHGVCETDITQFVARSDGFSLATQKDLRFEAGKHAKQTWQGIIVLVLPGSEALGAVPKTAPERLCSDFRR